MRAETRELLRARGYFYHNIQRTWTKDVHLKALPEPYFTIAQEVQDLTALGYTLALEIEKRHSMPPFTQAQMAS